MCVLLVCLEHAKRYRERLEDLCQKRFWAFVQNRLGAYAKSGWGKRLRNSCQNILRKVGGWVGIMPKEVGDVMPNYVKKSL